MSTPAGTVRPAASDTRFDLRLLPAMVLGAVLNPINSSIIAVSLVPIAHAFDVPASRTVWLVSALYVATAIGQPVVGRLVDLYGPRRLFLMATILTGLAGLIGTLASSFDMLVVARVVLGFGTCAGYPAAMTLIKSEARRTGQESPAGVLTVLAISTQTISVIGPTLGGLLIDVGGWRATFALNLPLAAIAFVAGFVSLPRAGRRPDDAPRVHLDLPGMGAFAVVLVSLMVFLLDLRWTHTPLLAITALAAAALVRRELSLDPPSGRQPHATMRARWRRYRCSEGGQPAIAAVPCHHTLLMASDKPPIGGSRLGAPEPFLDLRVLGGNGPLLLSYLRSFLAMTVAYSMLYGFTQWLEDGRGLSASHAGLLLLPLSLTALGVSALTGRRPVIRGKLVVGATLQVVAGLLLLTLGGDAAIWLLVVVALVAGVPQGLNNLAIQNAVFHQADAASLGASSGLLRTFGYLGAMAASAATGAFFGQTASTGGLHHLAVFILVVGGLFLIVTLPDRSLTRLVPTSEENR